MPRVNFYFSAFMPREEGGRLKHILKLCFWSSCCYHVFFSLKLAILFINEINFILLLYFMLPDQETFRVWFSGKILEKMTYFQEFDSCDINWQLDVLSVCQQLLLWNKQNAVRSVFCISNTDISQFENKDQFYQVPWLEAYTNCFLLLHFWSISQM